MPKVSKVGKFRKTAALSASLSSTSNPKKPQENPEATTTSNPDAPSKSPILSKGQRKRQDKKKQYLKRENLVMSSLSLRRMDEQRKKIDGLDALKEALMSTVTKNEDETNAQKNRKEDDTKSKESSCVTNKAKQNLADKEAAHMNLVLQHPLFQKDPFGTIQEHLKNTLAKTAEKEAAIYEKRKREEDKTLEEKKRTDKVKKKNKVKDFKKRKMTSKYKGRKAKR